MTIQMEMSFFSNFHNGGMIFRGRERQSNSRFINKAISRNNGFHTELEVFCVCVPLIRWGLFALSLHLSVFNFVKFGVLFVR